MSTLHEMTTIPLSQIILSTRIVEMVKKYDPNFDSQSYKIINDGSFPLNNERLQSILQCKVNLPPIVLDKNFTVINGRHRVAASLIQKKTHINFILHT